MGQITTHVLETSSGRPAEGMKIKLQFFNENKFKDLNDVITNRDGRVLNLLPVELEKGIYRLSFETGEYYKKLGKKCFYPEAIIIFEIDDLNEHYHIPLLISGHGYSTYRGS